MKPPKLKRPTIQQINWYGFDHKAINERFEGDLTFVNTFCLKDEYDPVSVYKAKKPNRKKGHKDYMLLQTSPDGGALVRGRDEAMMKYERYQRGAQCLNCNDIIYSVMRHDFRSCSCGAITVDGGKDYFKGSYSSRALFKDVTIDLLKNKVVKNEYKS